MSPCWWGRLICCGSFPRVSGDEPDYVSGKMEGIKFSPRERG